MIKVPCQGCTKRTLHCHSQCSLYADYKQQLQQHKYKVNEQRALDSFLFLSKQALMKKGATRIYYNKKAR